MEVYSYHHGPLKSGSEFLFNERSHLDLQAASGWHSFYALKSPDKVVALIHFHVNDGQAQSPLRAPFGTVEFSDITPKGLYDFLIFVEATLVKLNVKYICIKDAPALLREAQSPVLHTLLINMGYRVKNAKLSAVIRVRPDLQFENWEQRKLRQGRKEGLVFSEQNASEGKAIYRFIAECRQAKGFPISMTEDEMGRTISVFANRFRYFAVHQKGTLAAACIALFVRKDVLYTFYFDHHRDLDALSPAVYLIEGICNWSLDQNVGFIDLGTSASERHPNFGLLDFKLRLGATPSAKLSFEKTLA